MINVILGKNGYPPWITDVKVENTKFHEFKLLIKRWLNGRLRRNLCKERIDYLEHVDWNLFKRTEIERIVDKLDNILHNKIKEDLMKNQDEITKKVTKFIDERFKADNDWTSGNCYFFALILKDVFKGKIFYDDVWGHFVVKIGKEFYDWKGVYTKKDGNLISLKGLKEVDSTHYKRIKKQCCR